MIFVARHSTIRLPLVLDAWVEHRDEDMDDETSICFIVVNYMDGLFLTKSSLSYAMLAWIISSGTYSISCANSAKPRPST
jgi:hypothetical protein